MWIGASRTPSAKELFFVAFIVVSPLSVVLDRVWEWHLAKDDRRLAAYQRVTVGRRLQWLSKAAARILRECRHIHHLANDTTIDVQVAAELERSHASNCLHAISLALGRTSPGAGSVQPTVKGNGKRVTAGRKASAKSDGSGKGNVEKGGDPGSGGGI